MWLVISVLICDTCDEQLTIARDNSSKNKLREMAANKGWFVGSFEHYCKKCSKKEKKGK